MTVVRAHPRKGTRGVRKHLRIVPAARPIGIELIHPKRYKMDRSVMASVGPGEDFIAFHTAPTPEEATKGDADAYIRVLGHETLHQALHRADELLASMMLDSVQAERFEITARRMMRQGHGPEEFAPIPLTLTKSGLHPAFPRRSRRVAPWY